MDDTDNRSNVIEHLAIGDLPASEQDAILATLGELTFKRTFVEALDSLEASKRAELEALLADEKQQEAEQFLQEHVPNLHAIIEQVAQEEMDALKRALDVHK